MASRKGSPRYRAPRLKAWTKADKDMASRLFRLGSQSGQHIVGRRTWKGMRDSAPEENGPVRVRKINA